MSAEHITNQQHIRDITIKNEGVQLEAIKQSIINDKLDQKRVPGIEQNPQKDASTIQQLLSQQSEKAKHQITKQSYEKMQENNAIINDGLSEQLEDQIDKFFNPKKNQFEDNVKLSDSILMKEKEKPDTFQQSKTASIFVSNKQKNEKEKIENTTNSWINQPEENEDSDSVKSNSTNEATKTDTQPKQSQPLDSKELKQLATMVSKYAISQDSNVKQQIEKQQKQLLQQGVSQKNINFVTAKVGLLIKEHMVYDLKQKLINYHMSKGFSKQEIMQRSLDYTNNANQFNALKDSGRMNNDANQLLGKLRHQAKQDLGNFLFEESVHQFTKQSLGQISLKEFTDELVKLQKAAQSAGVSISEKELSDKICAAIDHLGLGEFTPPNPNNQQQQQKEPTRIISNEEALDDKLRYLYMIKALHPSLRHKIDVHFKMKKCRNGMIKLGFYTEEKEELLKKQGEFLAAKQFTEELEFIFREEATLPNLNGSTYGVLRKKKAFFITQLRKIEFGPSQTELERIKESAYRDMYNLIKEKVMQLEDMVEIHQNVAYTRQLKTYKEVIKRITTDVLVNDHQSNVDQLTAPIMRSTINEGA